jgi:hypothetical protein
MSETGKPEVISTKAFFHVQPHANVGGSVAATATNLRMH